MPYFFSSFQEERVLIPPAGRRRPPSRAEAQAHGAAPSCCVRRRRGPFRRQAALRAASLAGMPRLGYGLRLLEAGSGSRAVTRLPLGADMPKKAGATNKASGNFRGRGRVGRWNAG